MLTPPAGTQFTKKDGTPGLEVLERPLRASTPQGERVTLVRSDSVPVGTTLEFTLRVLGAIRRKVLEEWFGYGLFRGLCQWRNGGYGRFQYELENITDELPEDTDDGQKAKVKKAKAK